MSIYSIEPCPMNFNRENKENGAKGQGLFKIVE
jgi:hypothetical protein